MAQMRMKVSNPLLSVILEKKMAEKRQNREDREADEGIVADLEDITSEEGEDVQFSDAELSNDELDMPAKNGVRTETPRKKPSEQIDEYINPSDVHASITDLFEKEKEALELMYNSRNQQISALVSADMFFISILLVPPNKYRPEALVGGDVTEAQDNSLYKRILQTCDLINQIRKDIAGTATDESHRKRDFRDLQNAWIRLQDAVNSMIDSDRNPAPFGAAGRQVELGIKQKLEKKEGLFRKNMMGKRVNFAARSVISPDPNIETNEIGIPPVFAMKLTYPEPVTSHNFLELKQAVLNGTEKWPGAAAIENENGQIINLRLKNFEDRQALANQLLAPSNTSVNGARNKKVHRHLNNGDIVIMNRQPTLHKPSMMAHRAKVLPGEKTIRMHYTNCNTYNADFDGDEMNMHFPQNEIARSEALTIADTDHQYLVATSGKPLRGLIQDHISMAVWLTSRDTVFDRGDYYQLLYSCLRPENHHTISDRIIIVPPAIVKPRPMWTGKQVITTVLKNITPVTHPGLTLEGKSQTPGDRWGVGLEEDIVHFQDGEMLSGILDKAHLGPTGGGFVHSIYEVYGHVVAGQMLSILGRLLTKFLNMRGFTCGMDDLDLTLVGEKDRREKLQEAENLGLEVAAKYVMLDDKPERSRKELRDRLEEVFRDEEKQAGLDIVYGSKNSNLSSEITKICLPTRLRKPFPKNQMQAMTTSGAKGSSVNANQISCNLGQQTLEGRRVPVMVSGKTLPSFKPFETKIRAGGYIGDRFLTGIKPQEYYFHAMAGREGLIDTAVKTSRSGYLQRCLIKGMEGLKTQYDSSIRDADGSMVQFLYGEDGLDITKQKHLTDFKFLAENHLSVIAQLNLKDEFNKLTDLGVKEKNKDAIKIVKKTGKFDAIDPVLASYNPGAVYGSTSEEFASALRKYCDDNPHGLIKDKRNKKTGLKSTISKKTFQTLLDVKYMKSVIEPGEAVGIVAGQSIGEPSTQMTLNTFHLAGHSAKNVTLGIPRLREIVMTASRSPSTPAMRLSLINELDKSDGERFAKMLSKLTLAEVIENAQVTEHVGEGTGYKRARIYVIKLNLFPRNEYQETYATDIPEITRCIELKFIPELIRMIKHEFKRRGDAALLKASEAQPNIGVPTGTIEQAPPRPEAEREGGDDDEDDDGDDDATNNKQKQNRLGAASYGAPDEEEEAIARNVRRQSTPDSETEDEGISRSPSRNGSDDQEADDEADLMANGLEERIRNFYPVVTQFSFDSRNGAWCEFQLEYDASTSKLLLLPILESALHGSVIRSIPGIKSAVCSEEKVPGTETKIPFVDTEGVNIKAMHSFQSIINPHKLETNDIGGMLDIYGVEAARNTIILEMRRVFQSHSISVDTRHLNLIADFMTRGGGFAPFNRMGMRGATSPFMKMSFETTVQFVANAVMEGDWDPLEGPSARIVAGKVSRMGTGSFDVLMPVSGKDKKKEGGVAGEEMDLDESD